jgi:hypothetical protein
MKHTMMRRICSALAIAGLVFGAPLVLAYEAGASPGHAGATTVSLKAAEQRATAAIAHQTSIERTENAASPNPVSLVSPIVGVMQTGAAVGPGIVSGVAVTGVSSIPVPAATSSQVDTAIVDVAGAIAQYGPPALQQVQAAIAPLACLNSALNAGITDFADATDSVTNALATVIDPLNVTLQQVATLAQSFEEPAPSC